MLKVGPALQANNGKRSKISRRLKSVQNLANLRQKFKEQDLFRALVNQTKDNRFVTFQKRYLKNLKKFVC